VRGLKAIENSVDQPIVMLAVFSQIR
jgi:hypothetical protein